MYSTTPQLLEYIVVLHIKKQQKFYSLPKRYNKIRRFEQRPSVGNNWTWGGGGGGQARLFLYK